MNIHHIHYAIEIAHYGSFNKAAANLFKMCIRDRMSTAAASIASPLRILFMEKASFTAEYQLFGVVHP